MKTSYVLAALMLFALISGASATYEQINETLYIYNDTNVRYRMIEDLDTNCNKIVCDNSICTELWVGIALTEDYSLDYELNYAPNESIYYTTIITVEQEEIGSTLYGLYKRVERTLSIDAVEVASYNATLIINSGAKSGFGFKSVDKTITFGKHTVDNTTLFFSELVIDDQYDLLANTTGYCGYNIKTVGIYGSEYSSLELGGFTGIFLSVIKKMPFIGESLYNVLYPVLAVIQYSIDFSFTLINLIINDWWYALLLLECMCLFVATQKSGYVNVVSAYIETHVQISMFIYHKIIIPMVTMIITILNTIKNMIQWW